MWANQPLVLYHGTTDTSAARIVAGPVSVTGRSHTDFGPGFYTTTLLRQAHTWAAQKSSGKPGARAAVVELILSRDDLATLSSLSFVRGDFHAEDFWSLVHQCRAGAFGHGRLGSTPFYDVVYGPVAAYWNQRMSIADADQISFHTGTAAATLNKSKRRRIV